MKKKVNGRQFQITDTWYFQRKQLIVAKARFCRELKTVFEPLLNRIENALQKRKI